MHYFYILHSATLERYYVGETSNISIRLDLHNRHHFKKAFTNSASDWGLVLKRECNNKDEALYLERFVKRMKSKKFTEKTIKNSKILDDILSRK